MNKITVIFIVLFLTMSGVCVCMGLSWEAENKMIGEQITALQQELADCQQELTDCQNGYFQSLEIEVAKKCE